MVMLHAGPPPSEAAALLALLGLMVAIFITAAIISEFQRDAAPPAKRGVRQRSQRARPDS